MPSLESLPAHSSTLSEPQTQREHLWDQIALEAATGASVGQLAARFGYTWGGMEKLTKREEFIARRAYYAARLEDEKFIAHRKLLLHLPALLDVELEVALRHPKPDSQVSQKARHYLVDKVLPTTTKVESTNEYKHSPEATEALVEFRDLLRRIKAEADVGPRRGILESPHVLEGAAALPSTFAGLPTVDAEVVKG